MISVTGAIVARPDTLQPLLEEALAHVRRSRLEDGCIAHNVAYDCENQLRLMFVEQWRDRDALDTHFAAAGSNAFVAAVHQLAESIEPMTICEIRQAI